MPRARKVNISGLLSLGSSFSLSSSDNGIFGQVRIVIFLI
jgi:hypothetical protein